MSKTYFASDFHLGSPNYVASLEREKNIVNWLNSIAEDASTLFLVGDVFDFWYEYKRVIPKYHTRILAKLAQMTDAGIKIYFFRGNHDMWTFDYLSTEIGLEIIDEEWEGEIGYVQDIVLKQKINLAKSQVYACGSVDMITSSKHLFMNNGLPEHQFYSDALVSTN